MKVKNNIARQKNTNKFNLSKQTITTTDFGVKRPILCNVQFPGDKFVVNIDHLTRLMPMPNPTFGKIKETIRCFTVPYRNIHKYFNDVLANNMVYINNSKVIPETHWIYLGDFVNAIYDNSKICTPSDENNYDVAVHVYSIDDENVTEEGRNYYLYTQNGRHVISMLQGLGYNLPTMYFQGGAIDYLKATDKRGVGPTATIKISLYPLIAFWKTYIDWCVPSRFLTDIYEIVRAVENFYRSNGHEEGIAGSQTLLNNFIAMTSTAPVTYNADDNYFSRAFLNPYGEENERAKTIIPANTIETQNGYLDYNETSLSIDKHASDNGSMIPYTIGPNNDGNLINIASIKTLGALQDMVNRGKLNGTRVKDYLKATYGIEPSLSELEYSEYKGKRENTIMIGDVIANADTKTENGGAYLGEYAGRAIGGDQNQNFTIEAKEHQLVIITHELKVENSYMQGLTPETWLIDKMDFFQPEFDGLDMQPITYKELYASELMNRENPTLSNSINLNGIWGWIERYAHFKKNTDTLSGDFRRHSVNEGLESWFLARKFEIAQFGYLEWIEGINPNFIKQYSETTSENYDKIFLYQGSDVDHFYSVFNIQIDAYRYMKSLETPFEFEDDEGRTMENNFQGNID